MSKKLKIIVCVLVVLGFGGAGIFQLWKAGFFIFVRSAVVSSTSVKWEEKEYSPIGGQYSEGRTIAKARNGNWVIRTVEEDPSHTFVVARSFLDQYLMVLDNYTVPTSGNLTSVYWNRTYISDPAFLDVVSRIEAEKTTSFTYQTNAIFHLTENQYMRELWFAYENCPIATNNKGYMGKVNGEWVITTCILSENGYDDLNPGPYSVSCYRIPSEYWDVLSKYFP